MGLSCLTATSVGAVEPIAWLRCASGGNFMAGPCDLASAGSIWLRSVPSGDPTALTQASNGGSSRQDRRRLQLRPKAQNPQRPHPPYEFVCKAWTSQPQDSQSVRSRKCRDRHVFGPAVCWSVPILAAVNGMYRIQDPVTRLVDPFNKGTLFGSVEVFLSIVRRWPRALRGWRGPSFMRRSKA
jgi:hypothetical protein